MSIRAEWTFPIDAPPDSDQDLELGLVNLTSSPAALGNDSNGITSPTIAHEPAAYGHQLHEVIGDALEVFLRHLWASH